jgi:hypothetical protein
MSRLRTALLASLAAAASVLAGKVQGTVPGDLLFVAASSGAGLVTYASLPSEKPSAHRKAPLALKKCYFSHAQDAWMPRRGRMEGLSSVTASSRYQERPFG